MKNHTEAMPYRGEKLEERNCVHCMTFLALIPVFYKEYKKLLVKINFKKAV